MPSEVVLYLVRHAIAEERGAAWPDDDVRPLSRDGIRKWRRGAAGFASLVPDLDLVLSSPLLRARQTADILQGALPTRPPVEQFDVLAPDHPPTTVIRALRQRGAPARVALVGHEPSLSRLGATLLRLDGALMLRKGSVLAVAVMELGARGPGRLEWFASPRMLRRIGREASSD
ncbi:MAG: SixA phosphatase family protein [Vicinamibacteria bacterium]